MSLPVEFHPAVQNEADDGYRWYEQKSPGLGREFLNEVERVISEIVANPARYGFAERDIREGQLRRFPYAVYYRVLPNRIRVLAVFNAYRDPAIWQARS